MRAPSPSVAEMAETAETAEQALSIPVTETVFPPFDTTTYPSQIFWLVVTFALFYAVVSKVIVPRLSGMLEGRRDKIAGDISQADKLQKDVQKIISAHEKTLEKSRRQAHEVLANTRADVDKQLEQERKMLESRLAEDLHAAETRLQKAEKDLLEQTHTLALPLITSMIKKLSGVSVTKKKASAQLKKL